MKRSWIKALCLGALLASCGNEGGATSFATETTVMDMAGRSVCLRSGGYSHVVCIGAGALRLYSYIGEAAGLGGVEDIDNTSLASRPKMFDAVARPYLIANEEAYHSLPSCGVGGPNAQSPEAEKILSCHPDLILSEYADADQMDALQEKVGVPVICLSYGSAGVFDEKLSRSLTLLGTVLGKEARAAEVVSYIQSEKAELSRRVSGVATKRKAYICGLGNWGTTNQFMTCQNYEPFNVCAIENVVTGLVKDGIQSITEERFNVAIAEADQIYLDAAAIKNIIPALREDPDLFSASTAWNEGEVYLQMAYNAYYTNVELALANAWWNAKCAYPSLFEDIDMAAKTNEVTKAFLGQELAAPIFQSYANSFGGYQKINPQEFFSL